MKTIQKLILAISILSAVEACADGHVTMSDDQIRSLLRAKVENRQTVGIVIGVLDDSGPRVFAFGKTARENGMDIDGDTLFEIGSVTKTFTCLMLADMVQRGEVGLNDPISKYMPPGIGTPTRKGKEIKLVDLATHTSGLPRMPSNFDPKDPENPYADYTLERMWKFVSMCKLDRNIGEKYEYSNLGMGLLGSLLARRAGTNYETLLTERILRPLDMTSTFITLPAAEKARFAQGHDATLQPAHAWDFDALAGCGAIRSSVNNLLKYLAANMGMATNSLSVAMDSAHQPLRPTTIPNTMIGLGWQVTERDGHRVVWHNGQTGGYHSCLAFDPTNKVGAIVLVNAAADVDDIAMRLVGINKSAKHPTAPAASVAIQVDPAKLKRLVGRYEMTPGADFNLRLDGEHLMAQLTGQEYYEIFPTSETNFFYKVVDAQISFNCDATGKVRSLTLHQNGGTPEALKISDEAPTVRQAIAIDATIFDDYAGAYVLPSGGEFTIRRDGDRLLAKLTGQSFYQIFPETETNFFYKIVDAQITFVRGADGKTTALVLHQNGVDQTATKSP